MVVKSHLQALGLFVVALPWQSSPAIAEPPASGRVWTLDDAVAAPEVTDLAISGDGSRAAYLLRTVDLAKDQLKTIESLCGTGCEEYQDLHDAIRNPSKI